jgi:hypothetical protein
MEEDPVDILLRRIREREEEIGGRPLFMGDFYEPEHIPIGGHDNIRETNRATLHVMPDMHLHAPDWNANIFDIIGEIEINEKVHPPKPSISAKVKVKTVNGKLVKE